MLTTLIGLGCGLVAAVIVVAILHPRVDDGIVVKLGLIAMAAGFGSAGLRLLEHRPDAAAMVHAIVLIEAGAVVALAGGILRSMRRGRQ
jgi:hypothetical protein